MLPAHPCESRLRTAPAGAFVTWAQVHPISASYAASCPPMAPLAHAAGTRRGRTSRPGAPRYRIARVLPWRYRRRFGPSPGGWPNWLAPPHSLRQRHSAEMLELLRQNMAQRKINNVRLYSAHRPIRNCRRFAGSGAADRRLSRILASAGNAAPHPPGAQGRRALVLLEYRAKTGGAIRADTR